MKSCHDASFFFLRHQNSLPSGSFGIATSNEFHRASIPIEQFAETGLALANGGTSGQAKVDLTLYSPAGRKLEAEAVRLGARSHRARFLHEFFPEQTLERGRVEISSEALFSGRRLPWPGRNSPVFPWSRLPLTTRFDWRQGTTSPPANSPCGRRARFFVVI